MSENDPAPKKGGATALEYGLIAAVLGIGIVAALGPVKDWALSKLPPPFGTAAVETQQPK